MQSIAKTLEQRDDEDELLTLSPPKKTAATKKAGTLQQRKMGLREVLSLDGVEYCV